MCTQFLGLCNGLKEIIHEEYLQKDLEPGSKCPRVETCHYSFLLGQRKKNLAGFFVPWNINWNHLAKI